MTEKHLEEITRRTLQLQSDAEIEAEIYRNFPAMGGQKVYIFFLTTLPPVTMLKVSVSTLSSTLLQGQRRWDLTNPFFP